jgi:hypothetical protein
MTGPKPEDFIVPKWYKRTLWDSVKEGDIVYLLGVNYGEPHAYGPFKVLSTKDRTVTNSVGMSAKEPLEFLLVKEDDVVNTEYVNDR